MGEKLDDCLLWRITAIDTHQYCLPSDNQYIRFELRNESDLTNMEVTLLWSGAFIDLIDALETEVHKRIKRRLP